MFHVDTMTRPMFVAILAAALTVVGYATTPSINAGAARP